MNVALFNGSPRRKKSNTAILLKKFVAGLESTGKHQVTMTYLMPKVQPELWRERFAAADYVLLALPLYTDCMPGIGKEFIEALAPLKGQEGLPRFTFLVQSGFPEGAQSRALEAYFDKLCRRLGVSTDGTLIRGGVEGIQIMPPFMTRKLFAKAFAAGQALGTQGHIPEDIVHGFPNRENLSRLSKAMVRFMRLLGKSDFYWDGQLKANNAYDRRFDRPYEPGGETPE